MNGLMGEADTEAQLADENSRMLEARRDGLWLVRAATATAKDA